jgi:hypothetical protein
MSKSFKQICYEALDLHYDNSKKYENAYKEHGNIMKAIFPNGIELKTADDFCRYSLFDIIISKLHRYSKNFLDGGHQDSIRDAGVYALMLEEVDGIIDDEVDIAERVEDKHE